MQDYDALNQFVESIYAGVGGMLFSKPVPVNKETTALVVVDVQNSVTVEAIKEEMKSLGMSPDSVLPLLNQLDELNKKTFQNIELLLKTCRGSGIIPIHIRVESLLPDGSDVGHFHTKTNVIYPKGSFPAQFVSQAQPLEDEIVLTKTCSGIHVGTRIDQILRNLKIQNVIVAGFYTDQCISTSVRDLADLGFDVVLAEDATMAMSMQRHVNALESLRNLYANVETTESLVKRISERA